MTPLNYQVTVERITTNQLQGSKLKESLEYIAEAAERNQTYNFSARIKAADVDMRQESDGDGGNQYRYTATITVTKSEYRSVGAVRDQFDRVIEVMKRAANKKRWTYVGEGKIMPPTVTATPTGPSPNGHVEPVKAPKIIRPNTDVSLPALTPEVFTKYFGRLFNREAHIRIIYDSLKQAVSTKFKERNHVLLRGLAGCAKTEIFLGFEDWLGPDMIWSVDATTLTKAGLERELVQRSNDRVLPPIVKLEEVEKVTDEKTTNCLLQVMDVRGRISRVNGRDGETYAECKVVLWATCNDSKLLRTFADGALWSRFNLRPICKRPDKDTMRKILMRITREVAEEGGYCGDHRHVDKVLNFMWDELAQMKEYKKDYNDPRLGRALLSGGDRILDEGPQGFMADFAKVCDGDESGEDTAE